MPKGVQGQKHLADANGYAVTVARIAISAISNNKKSGRIQSGKVGGSASVQALFGQAAV